MIPDSKADAFLQALKVEAIKVFRVYDGSDRLITSFETLANTANNGPALKTEYTYVGASNRVEKLKETLDVWSDSYDI